MICDLVFWRRGRKFELFVRGSMNICFHAGIRLFHRLIIGVEEMEYFVCRFWSFHQHPSHEPRFKVPMYSDLLSESPTVRALRLVPNNKKKMVTVRIVTYTRAFTPSRHYYYLMRTIVLVSRCPINAVLNHFWKDMKHILKSKLHL